MAFLANDGIVIAGPCDDPFYSASQRIAVFDTPLNFYLADYPMTVMGCVDQYMIMDRTSGQYTNWSGVLDIPHQTFTDFKSWKFSNRQVAALADLSWVTGQVGGIGGVLIALGAEALRAKKLVETGGSQTRCPVINGLWKRATGSI